MHAIEEDPTELGREDPLKAKAFPPLIFQDDGPSSPI